MSDRQGIADFHSPKRKHREQATGQCIQQQTTTQGMGKLQAIGGQKGPKQGGAVHPTSSSGAHCCFHVHRRQNVKENKALKCCRHQSPTDTGHHRLTYLAVAGPRRLWPGCLAELPLQSLDLLLELLTLVLALSSLLLDQEATCEDSTLGGHVTKPRNRAVTTRTTAAQKVLLL